MPSAFINAVNTVIEATVKVQRSRSISSSVSTGSNR
jgi:hypothetical protein